MVMYHHTQLSNWIFHSKKIKDDNADHNCHNNLNDLPSNVNRLNVFILENSSKMDSNEYLPITQKVRL
jgi:hypothetical protein